MNIGSEDSPGNLVFLAKTAEEAERYEEMKIFMSRLFEVESNPTKEHVNLLSVAFKNMVGSLRASLRVIDALISRQRNLLLPSNKFLNALEKLRTDLILKLNIHCKEAVSSCSLFESKLDPTSSENRVFFNKLRCDYYRYLVENPLDENSMILHRQKLERMEEKVMESIKDLPPTHVIRLSYMLNYSVRLFDCNETRKAVDIAKTAFELAIEKIDELNETDYKDATILMQLLRDNLTYWTRDIM